MLRDQVALDPCSGCLHDGGSQQGPHPLGHGQTLCHPPGRELNPAEGIASFSSSPQQLQTCRSSLLEGAPSSLPLSGWEQIPEEPRIGLTGLTGAQLWVHQLHRVWWIHMPSPLDAFSSPGASTNSDSEAVPPETTRHLQPCASLQCELVPREQWARSHQGSSADSCTHRDGTHRGGRRLHQLKGFVVHAQALKRPATGCQEVRGLFRFRDLPKPNRYPKLFFMKD